MCGHRAEALAAAAAAEPDFQDEPSPLGSPVAERDTTFNYEQEHRLRSVRRPCPGLPAAIGSS